MAEAVWPPSLPSEALQAGLVETPPALTVRTEMSVGPAKVRRRFTAGVRVFELPPFILTRDQVAIFDAFFLDDLQGGALPFTWKHPRTANPIDFRIIGTPRYSPLSPRQNGTVDRWQVTIALEALPGTEVTGDPPEPPDPDRTLLIPGPYGGDDAGVLLELEELVLDEAPAAIDTFIFVAAPAAFDLLMLVDPRDDTTGIEDTLPTDELMISDIPGAQGGGGGTNPDTSPGGGGTDGGGGVGGIS